MIRDVSYKINVLRGGAEFKQLSWAADAAPNVYVRKDSEIKGSLSAEVYPDADVDLLSDELQPVLVLDGVETPLGVFQATTVEEIMDAYGRRLRIEAYDRCWRVQQSRTEGLYHIAANTPYLTAVQQLLTAAGIKLVLAVPSSAVMATDREDWDTGTDHLTICNQLLEEINYNPVWFDGRGICHLEPYKAPTGGRIDHAYSSTDLQIAPITDDHTQEIDLFDAPNVFVRICSNPDRGAPLTATAVNDSPTSSTSTFRRGLRIVDVAKVNNVASQDELQELVNRLRNESMHATKTITFYTLATGGHGVGDIVSIDDPDIGGIWEETEWSLTMAVGELMQHTARRVVIA